MTKCLIIPKKYPKMKNRDQNNQVERAMLKEKKTSEVKWVFSKTRKNLKVNMKDKRKSLSQEV